MDERIHPVKASPASLEVLVLRAKAGDRAAFEEILGRLRPRLELVIGLRLGKHLRDRLDVEDVLQETLLRAWQGLGRFEWKDEASLFSWFSRIAERVILEEAKRRKEKNIEDLESEPSGDAVSPGKALRRKERFQTLREALEALPPDYRQVLLGVWIDGLPVNEIARRMDRSPNAVSHLILRALRKLREIFGDTESLGLPALPLDGKGDSDGR
jgi:RNA polymerase sigma factor (sigma-70 family)